MSDRNGCYNREPFKESLEVQDGYVNLDHTRIARMKTIPFVMSRECKHDKKDTDPKCQGCRWQKQ